MRADEVLKIWESIFCCHLEEWIYLGTLPWEIFGDVVCWDREGKCPSPIVSLSVDLEECSVDDHALIIELSELFVILSCVVSSEMERLLGEICRAGPVERDIGEWCLCPPTRWDIEPEDKVLHLLEHIVVCFFIDIVCSFLFCWEKEGMRFDICIDLLPVLVDER